MVHKHISGQFLATALATLANGITAKDGSEFTSRAINIENVDYIAVQLVATGADALIAGDITAYFAGSPNKTKAWDTFNDTSQAFASATLTMTTNAVERHSSLIDVRGLAWIKLMALANAAGKGITSANVAYGRSVEIG